LCKEIGGPCFGYTYDLAWALIGLNELVDWSTHYACGWGEMVELTLDRIKQNDVQACSGGMCLTWCCQRGVSHRWLKVG